MKYPVDIVNFWLIFGHQYCCTFVEHLCLIQTMCHLVHWLLNDTFCLEGRSPTRRCIMSHCVIFWPSGYSVSLLHCCTMAYHSTLCSCARQRVNKGSKTESCVIAACALRYVCTSLSASFQVCIPVIQDGSIVQVWICYSFVDLFSLLAELLLWNFWLFIGLFLLMSFLLGSFALVWLLMSCFSCSWL